MRIPFSVGLLIGATLLTLAVITTHSVEGRQTPTATIARTQVVLLGTGTPRQIRIDLAQQRLLS